MITAKVRGATQTAGTKTVHLPEIVGAKMSHRSNKTKLAGCVGLGTFTCPICFVVFNRYWAWAKRYEHQYCGVGCRHQAQKIEVSNDCVVCGCSFVTNPSGMKRTCSQECYRICRARAPSPDWLLSHARTQKRKNVGYEAYYRVRAKIIAAPKCSSCSAVHGPWVVMNLKPLPDGSGYDEAKASVVCKPCYLRIRGEALGEIAKAKAAASA